MFLFAAGAFGQFEIAAGLGVEGHEAIDAIAGHRGNLAETRSLCFGEVFEQPTSRSDRSRSSGETKPVERFDFEMVSERVCRSFVFPEAEIDV